MAKVNVEQVKLESRGLRGTIETELADPIDHFTEAAKQLLKFHGMYQQEDRDARKRDRENSQHSFMIRSKIPGGQMTAAQYLAHDDIASKYANGTLRITTRQGFQFHGILKGDIRGSLIALNEALVTTLGACGDVVRNVMACPAPTADPQRRAVQDFAFELTTQLYPRTSAYHEIWLDGEKLTEEKVIEDPLYGKTYLPRKFKIAIAYPGDNCVDVFTNDVGLVAIFDEAGTLAGFNVLAGGGMGMTHNNDATYARLADVVGFVEPSQVVETVKGIVGIHRDFGDRQNRKHARLKYVLEERGVVWFREELGSRLPFPVQDARPMPDFEVDDHMGWHEQGDGLLYLGVPVENGRILDRGDYRLRTGIRAIVEQFNLPIRLTAQQSLLICDIQPADRAAIETLLAEHQIQTVEQISGVRRNGLACPAMPTCGLAITEAERALPGVLDELEEALETIGLPDEPIFVRMTGCPNGCARPYVAEIAFVGRSLEKYMVFLGGNPAGTRLAKPFLDLVHIKDLIPTLQPVLASFRDNRQSGEAFGDYCVRVGLDSLRELTQAVVLN